MEKVEIPERFRKRIDQLKSYGMPDSCIPGKIAEWERQEAFEKERDALMRDMEAVIETCPAEMQEVSMTAENVNVRFLGGPEKVGPNRWTKDSAYIVVKEAVLPEWACTLDRVLALYEKDYAERADMSLHDLEEYAEDGDEYAQAVIRYARACARRDWVRIEFVPEESDSSVWTKVGYVRKSDVEIADGSVRFKGREQWI